MLIKLVVSREREISTNFITHGIVQYFLVLVHVLILLPKLVMSIFRAESSLNLSGRNMDK